MIWQWLADAVLTVHAGVVIFVVLGLVLVLVGNRLGWPWVNVLWFRVAHLAAIAVVVAQAWLGVICPLTTLEAWLRRQAGQSGYEGSFVEHWLQQVLYYDAPAWIFIALYTGFGLLVIVSWCWFPPRRRHR